MLGAIPLLVLHILIEGILPELIVGMWEQLD